MTWHGTVHNDSMNWTCGYCGKLVGGVVGYRKDPPDQEDHIYICPHCDNPTAFISSDFAIVQIPSPSYGEVIGGLPASVSEVYEEARRCFSCRSYTGTVLLLRKLLMHIAVEHGAEPGGSFVSYVERLADDGYIPPNGKGWVDEIRKMANEATHELVTMGREDAERLLDFSEMLLRFVYEFPSRIRPS